MDLALVRLHRYEKVCVYEGHVPETNRGFVGEWGGAAGQATCPPPVMRTPQGLLYTEGPAGSLGDFGTTHLQRCEPCAYGHAKHSAGKQLTNEY